ncbi:hypothetical protein HHI36_001456 [Cryptolaemus montrouzieri]|uniref:Uncharacterized protein n=1 Tax=Cryptolaemus montrouzieri TaxID=559131 RepID=A0ABD2P909_9CUCU
MNIIKTIEDDEEVEDFSEESDEEIEYQPVAQKSKNNGDFDNDFSFVTSVEEYNRDPWNDLNKYIKRKAKTKTDDKIKKIRLENGTEEDDHLNSNGNSDSEYSLSEDELKHDKIKVVEKKEKEKT